MLWLRVEGRKRHLRNPDALIFALWHCLEPYRAAPWALCFNGYDTELITFNMIKHYPGQNIISASVMSHIPRSDCKEL